MQHAAPGVEARSSVYRLLAGLFARELTAENIAGFKQGSGSQLLDTLENELLYSALASNLKMQFSKMADPRQAALDLAESYAWNFHGAGGPHAAPLYASVYLSESGSTHQEVERELRKIICEYGLRSDIPHNEPYDHISVILEFVAWLDDQEEHLQQQGFRREIIEKYLLSWLPDFVNQCHHADKPGFYSDLATVTLGLVKADFAHYE